MKILYNPAPKNTIVTLRGINFNQKHTEKHCPACGSVRTRPFRKTSDDTSPRTPCSAVQAEIRRPVLRGRSFRHNRDFAPAYFFFSAVCRDDERTVGRDSRRNALFLSAVRALETHPFAERDEPARIFGDEVLSRVHTIGKAGAKLREPHRRRTERRFLILQKSAL